MPRTLGDIAALLTEENIEYWDFVRIEFPAPIGVVRYTNRPGGYVGDIDGSAQEWFETNFETSGLRQSVQDVMIVNWIKFANLDYTWTNFAYNPGLRGVPVTIYVGWWNVNTTPSVFEGSYIAFRGVFDDAELKDYAQITLKPHHTPWNNLVPPNRMAGKCTNDYRNLEDCQYQGDEPLDPATGQVQLTCGKTRYDCRLRGNEINSNIYDALPKPGEQIMYGGIRHGLVPSPNSGR